MDFTPHTDADWKAMLKSIGVKNAESLYEDIPEALKNPGIHLSPGLSEIELTRHINNLASAVSPANGLNSFLGAGAYQHFIPSVVGEILSRSEFYTAYTPYQPEMSQGLLQAIFEYQSMICALTGLPVSNASLYDGASATAEAALMCLARHKGRNRIVVSRAVNPQYRRVLSTYLSGLPVEIVTAPFSAGVTDLEQLSDLIDERCACLILQNPNFFGCLEPMKDAADLAHTHGSSVVAVVNPISLGILIPPSEYSADIAVGEGQPLGNSLNFGGPYLGFICTTIELCRKLPGRIVGLTKDTCDQRAFVLTLQAREQHIRREKATSNICSNEALNALAAAVYMAAMGKQGIRKVAELCMANAHLLAGKISEIPGFSLKYDAPFFHEFVCTFPEDPESINSRLLEHGILGGLPLKRDYPEMSSESLLCATEVKTKDDIETFVHDLKNMTKISSNPEIENRKSKNLS